MNSTDREGEDYYLKIVVLKNKNHRHPIRNVASVYTGEYTGDYFIKLRKFVIRENLQLS